jgi:hypothetical protein
MGLDVRINSSRFGKYWFIEYIAVVTVGLYEDEVMERGIEATAYSMLPVCSI